MITCRQFIDSIGDEIFDRDHLDGCASCRAYLETYIRTIALLGGLRTRPTCEVPEELVRTILSLR